MRRSILAALALGPLVVLTADCREPTQITLEITTDVKCEDLSNTSITVGRLGQIEEKPASTTTTTCTESGRVGSLVVVPSGDKDSEVAIRVVTGVKKSAEQCVTDAYQGGCIVARRAVRYVPHTPLTLPIEMSIDCLDIPCDATETCFKGSCVPAKIKCEEDPDSCTPENPDGGGVDSGADVSVDAGPDAPDVSVEDASDAADAADAADASEVDATVTCPTGKGECDGDLTQLCETDLTTDAKNCGTCQRDCLGGTCAASKCSAVTIWKPAAGDASKPTRLAVDQNFVYFVEADKRVFRIPKAGGQEVVLANNQSFANTLALDATYVYWTDHASAGAIRRVLKAGGPTETLAPNVSFPIGIALMGTDLYFANFTASGNINAMATTGGTIQPLTPNETWPRELTVIGSHVYWTTFSNNGFLKRVLLTGGTAEIVDSNLANSAAIASSATHVYYTLAGTGKGKGEIRRAAIDTLKVDPVAITQDDPRSIAVDSTFAYWTCNGDGTVKKAPIAGGVPAITLVSGLNGPLGIAIDATAIYFADTDNSRVMRVAK